MKKKVLQVKKKKKIGKVKKKKCSLCGAAGKKERLFLAIKCCEWLCSSLLMEVMPGWGLLSFHHKAPSGILARPRLPRPLALLKCSLGLHINPVLLQLCREKTAGPAFAHTHMAAC